MRYDPNVQPIPSEWLALEELDRVAAVEKFHRQSRIKLPRLQAHAVIHSVVETQIAEGIEPVIAAVERLQAEGLDRHEVIHAIGTVVIERISEAQLADPKFDDPAAWYYQELEKLTVEGWRNKFESPPGAG
jgi:hypothetical protein